MNGNPGQHKEHREGPRCLIQHLIPGCLVEEGTGRRISAVLVDASTHGLGLRTTAAVQPGTRLALLTLRGRVGLEVTWRAARGRGVHACGTRTVDAAVDMTGLLSGLL